MEVSESTQAIRKKLLSDAEEEAQKIKAEAEETIEEIRNAAQERAEAIKEAELERMKEHVESTRRQDIAEKKVEYHRRTQTAKSELIDDVFDKAKEKLQDYVGKSAYEHTLRELILEAGESLGGGDLLVRLNAVDQERMSKADLESLAKEIHDRTDTETRITLDENAIEAIGGAVVASADQKATVDNTLEARLERMKEQAKAELDTILFA
jgi:V/A-type H+-transporting ATPase subunit E